MATNADVELELAQKILGYRRDSRMLPKRYGYEVHLHLGERKRRRSADFETNWDPSTDSIRISFSPMEEEDEIEPIRAAASSATASLKPAEGQMSDLIRALDCAERRPGYEFVSLKWFRDSALAHEGFAWAADEAARHELLREAIDQRLILTSKVANPRPPNFPVTAIRLNRQMPAVQTVLGGAAGNPSAFRPVPIRGETLSATVLRDRR